ncbi:ThiF family adenylyltransferase [bacterium]|nr:ThiF family adenylyltransferase [bacterium]
MSQQLISRSADLKRLRDEGFGVQVKGNYLLIHPVPYVNASRQVQFGTLVSELSLAGDATTTPGTHVAFFSGDHPCHQDGTEIAQIRHGSQAQTLADGVVVQHSFSSKPKAGGYPSYYEKMTTYVAILSSPAQAIDPNVTAKTFPPVEASEEESVFCYFDTASSRAGINLVTSKLELSKLAIVGLGGTGSYVLDLVAKTPVKQIHIFDGDVYSNHNAFRSPGAPTLNELRSNPRKVNYFHQQYSKMHRHIFPHDVYIDASNVDLLREMDFVFLCLDRNQPKRDIVKQLEQWGKSFIDVGMGIELVDTSLIGILRTTTSTPEKRDHVWERQRIPFSGGTVDDEYSKNIQIADLNALNAALAVIKWKKRCGFYMDFEREHFSTYTIDGNRLTNAEQP